MFSGHQLLPHLNVLQHQFLKKLENDHERFRSTYFDLELLPYALGASWHAVSEFARIQRNVLESFPHESLKDSAFFGLAPAQRDLLSYMFDNFLDAARRTQNAVIHYLSRGFRMSLPSSMHDLIDGIEKGKVALPEPPQIEILRYWNENGQRLKDYRDLAQHHALVTSDARVIASDDGRVALYLLLPSNPEVKSAGKLVFGNPEIHAFPYAKRELKILISFCDWLTKGLIKASPGPHTQIALNVLRDPARLGAGVTYRGFVPPDSERLEIEIEELLQRLRAG